MIQFPMACHNILLAEDNPGDVLLMEEALKETGIKHTLFVAKNGKEAIDLIISGQIKPDLILLDINLPFVNGLEVLKRIKNSEKHCHIPVIMLTTSSSPRDIKLSYQLQASSYLCKPDTINQLKSLIQNISNYYFNNVELPT